MGGAATRTLPLPLGNAIGGGRHSRGLGPDLQEFLVMSLNPPDAAAASVDINGTLVVQPNSSRLFEATAWVSSAGPQSVLLVINGTPRAFAFTAYYFAPAFAAVLLMEPS